MLRNVKELLDEIFNHREKKKWKNHYDKGRFMMRKMGIYREIKLMASPKWYWKRGMKKSNIIVRLNLT